MAGATNVSVADEKGLYLKNSIELYDFRASYHEPKYEAKTAGVEFKLKNKGNRTLDKVEVTIFFKNAKGQIIAEENYSPVFVTHYSFSRDNNPLKPGYIWQLERGSYYPAKRVPDEWKEGSAQAQITDIVFAPVATNNPMIQ
jgi:hypothetical protein